MSLYLSGIQPSSHLHLGNYFGAIQPHIRLAQTNPALFFIADLHSLTTVTDAAALRRNSREIAATYLAFGLPESAHIFKQSEIPSVGNLSFILACRLGHGALSRAHAFKDKVAHGLDVNTGLFYYPVLMAADILLYGTSHVPVGQDQHQHLQITQDIARSFNAIYGETFVIPQAVFSDFPKIPGTDGKKMSKSYGNTIDLMCPPERVKSQVSKIITDSRPLDEPKEPDFPLYQITEPFLSLAEREVVVSRLRTGQIGYGELKSLLIERITSTFKEARELFQFYMNSTEGERALDERLAKGSAHARQLADATMVKVLTAIGAS